jgi:hypothetical protein
MGPVLDPTLTDAAIAAVTVTGVVIAAGHLLPAPARPDAHLLLA